MIDGVLHFELPGSGAAGAATATLVAGPENRLLAPPLARLLDGGDLAAAAAQFNPLVVVGPAGSGKSHLAQGLVRVWSARLAADELAYFTAADFGRERQAAEAEDRLPDWRRRVRRLRMLVVEDLDQLRRRATIQHELRTTIEAILAGGGLVVATAACEPMATTTLDPGLRDRLAAGLTVRLHPPELAARRDIVMQAAIARDLSLTPGQADALAQKPCTTPAQLLGRLGQHCAASAPDGAPPPAAADLLQQRAALRHILGVAARYFGLSQAAILGKSRRSSLVEARQTIVHLARKMTDLSYAEIGRLLGGRDHTTIMNADQRMTARLAADPAAQQTIDELDRLVGA